MSGEGLTPQQAQKIELPPWYHPFDRDDVIRAELENMGFKVPDYRSHFPGWGLFTRGDLILGAQRFTDFQRQQEQQGQGEQHG